MLSFTTIDWAMQIPNDSPKYVKCHKPFYGPMAGATAL